MPTKLKKSCWFFLLAGLAVTIWSDLSITGHAPYAPFDLLLWLPLLAGMLFVFATATGTRKVFILLLVVAVGHPIAIYYGRPIDYELGMLALIAWCVVPILVLLGEWMRLLWPQ